MIPYDSFVIRRGRLIIINNVNFCDEKLSERTGSDEDVRRLKEVFRVLGFDVDVTDDQSAAQMLQLITAGLISNYDDNSFQGRPKPIAGHVPTAHQSQPPLPSLPVPLLTFPSPPLPSPSLPSLSPSPPQYDYMRPLKTS